VFAILKRGLIENENMKERAIIAVIKDYDHVQELQELGLIRTEHVEMAAREGSWQLRRFAARSEMASETTLKRLAVDNDSDVRQAVRANPNWEKIKDSVEYQKRASDAVDRLNRIFTIANEVLDVADKDGWEKDYEISREFVQAVRVLTKPEFKEFLQAFASEEKRELMKDGVDTETLSILGQFFE
jgi:chromosome segregation and condensation protein ScpB